MSKRAGLPTAERRITARDLIDATNLEKQARSLAVISKPDPKQAELSDPEHQVIEIVSRRNTDRLDYVHDKVQSITGEAKAIPGYRRDIHLETLPNTITKEIMGTFQEAAAEIKEVVADERTKLAELRHFKDEHDLNSRSAKYPDSRLQHFGIIVILLFFESAVNAAFLFEVSRSGLLGGFLTAFLVAATNVALAVACGFLPCRYLNHKDKKHTAWIVPALLIGFSAIVFINLYFAHYRFILKTGEDAGHLAALNQLLSAPFELDLASYILLFAGLLFAIAAGIKGYLASDSYPGYEQVDRPYLQARNASEDLRTRLHGEIDGIRHKRILQHQNSISYSQKAIDRIYQRLAEFKVQWQQIEDLDEHDARAAVGAINRFRSLNTQVRADNCRPAYFAQDPEILLPTISTKAIQELPAVVDQAKETVLEHAHMAWPIFDREDRKLEAVKDKLGSIMLAIEASLEDGQSLPTLSALREYMFEIVPPSKEEKPALPPAPTETPEPFVPAANVIGFIKPAKDTAPSGEPS